MERPNDRWLRIICIPLVILIANLLFIDDSHFSLGAYLAWSVIGIGYSLLMWEATIRWLLYVRSRYLSVLQTRRRIILTFAGYFVIVSGMESVLIWLSDITHVATIAITPVVYLKLILVGLVSVLLVGTVYEFIYYLQKYKEVIQESEAVKKAGLQSQYDNLKNQVNPHFLFNSLNSLSALISENRQQAVVFLDELSSVYRYLLQAGQHSVVTLGEETTFLQAYRYLLDTRFGNALRWEIHLDETLFDRFLPPLTFQTLIENILRHNRLLPEHPLTLYIATEHPGTLIIRNTIHRKKAPLLAPQGGLTLLAMHYESLRLPAPVIEDDGHNFTVRLPLVSKEQLVALGPSVERNVSLP